MTDTSLQALSVSVNDESKPLAGLLRMCIRLGADTKSEALRTWAQNELQGYDDEAEVPSYRRLPSPPLFVDSTSGNSWAKDVTYDRLQLPAEAQEYIPEEIVFRHPLRELEDLAAKPSLSFRGGGFAAARSLWNKSLDWRQQVIDMKWRIDGSAFAGMVDQVRTVLVMMVSDLTVDLPADALPPQEKVDQTVRERVGVQYNTTIHMATGPTAIGTNAHAVGMSVQDVLSLLDTFRAEIDEIKDRDTSQLVEAMADLKSTLNQDAPETGEVVKKAGRFRQLAEQLGIATVSSSASGLTEALIALAMSGGFA